MGTRPGADPIMPLKEPIQPPFQPQTPASRTRDGCHPSLHSVAFCCGGHRRQIRCFDIKQNPDLQFELHHHGGICLLYRCPPPPTTIGKPWRLTAATLPVWTVLGPSCSFACLVDLALPEDTLDLDSLIAVPELNTGVATILSL
jgi:hypothetical protein